MTGQASAARPAGDEVRKKKYAGSWAGYLWHRLDALDFMNQAMSLAGTLLLCAFPFFLILAALAGRSVVTAIAGRLGLSKQAAADVGDLFTSSATTSAAVTGLAWVFSSSAGSARPPRFSACTSGCSDWIPGGPGHGCAS